MKISLLVTFAVAALSVACHAFASDIKTEDVLGKFIFYSAGSTVGDAYISVGVETKGRNVIEVHFVSVSVAWVTSDATAFNKDREISDTFSVMIHCRENRYSPLPTINQTQIAWNEYLSGKKYAWNDYSAADFMYGVRQEEKDKMTDLFKRACTYTDV